MNEIVRLGSPEYKHSCLVPSFGFGSLAEGQEYEYKRLGPVYAPLQNNVKIYVPRISAICSEWSTTNLLGNIDDWGHDLTKPRWETLRRKSDPKPETAYNVALLVTGKRQCYRHLPRRCRNRNPWYATLVSGHRECYVVWARQDFTIFDPVGRIANTENPIYAARSGKGAIYTEEIEYNSEGIETRRRLRYTRFEFSIFDKDPEKDDSLRVIVHASGTLSVDEPMTAPDGAWLKLLTDAQTGFWRNCKACPDDLREWWNKFNDQRQKEAADRAILNGTGFYDRVGKLHWQEALRLVEEPWQLNAVVHHHGKRPEFSSDGGNYCIPYETVPNMIKSHDCDEPRKAELMEMMEFYVQPSDSMWNYRGD